MFPLPLSPMEHFLVADQRADTPVDSFIELFFEGKVERNAMTTALYDAVHRHPLLACRLDQKTNPWVWQYDDSYQPKLWTQAERPNVDPKTGKIVPIDLQNEPGCLFWLDEIESGERLRIQLHHATSDGVGIRSVLIALLANYAKQSVPAEQWQETNSRKRQRGLQIDKELLLQRGDFSERKSKPIPQPMSGKEKLAAAYYFHFQRPQPLVPAKAASTKSGHSPKVLQQAESHHPEPVIHHQLDAEFSNQILDACHALDITINDLSLAIFFWVAAKWNQSHGNAKQKSRLRLLMPIDLRSRADLKMPATNRLSFSFLGRTISQCGDFPSLLQSVHEETEWIKQSHVYMDFLEGLDLICGRPRASKLATSISTNMMTSVLTYAGDISRGMQHYFPLAGEARQVGNVKLTDVYVVPPTRRGANLSIGICLNWKRICMSANYNRSVWSSSDAHAFFDAYVDAWKEVFDSTLSTSQGTAQGTAS